MNARNEVVEIISKITNESDRNELMNINNRLIKILSDLPNLNSDVYKGIELAISLINQKIDFMKQRKQFCINTLLTILGIINSIIIGYLTLK
jgi:hypothetical protein